MHNKVKLGIIGYGHIGSQHGRAIRDGKCPQVELTAVCDCDPARLELARKTNGQALNLYTEAKELIHSGTCEAVIIATPHYYHPSMAIEAMEAGLHVLVEKPAGVYTEQVERMNAVSAQHPELVYCMDFNQRTNPLYKKVKDLIADGELGELKRVIWIITDWYRSQSYYDQGGWRATWDGEGGGVLLNQNPHNLDLWQWMCGMPKRVKAQVYYGKHRRIEVEDDLYALVEYENGATGCYITTVGDAPGTNRLEIDGDQGKLVVENNALTFYRLRVSEPVFNKAYKGGLGKPEVWECKVPVQGTYTAHPGIINNFCDCILNGAPPIAPGVEGIRGLQISNAIHLSSWLDGAWVDLPVDGALFVKKLQEHCKEPLMK
ncbi:MAG: oxidoreductase [Subdoligranulum variabile]|nr:MAG: oxidoreductase [Subdoligranulum variabile]